MIIKNNKKTISGFTLIELMVATSIFVIVMLAAMSSLFVLLDTAKNSRALRFAMDNVNFAMESMTRSIRMGTYYYCAENQGIINQPSNKGKNCLNGGTAVSFYPQEKQDRIVYKWKYETENQKVIGGTIEKCDSAGCVPIVSPDVNIEKLKFFVDGSDENDRR